MTEEMDLYDSDTGDTLPVIKSVELHDRHGDPVTLLYTEAKRGRIVQVRRGEGGCVRIHYFYEDPTGLAMIEEDQPRNGVGVAAIILNAP